MTDSRYAFIDRMCQHTSVRRYLPDVVPETDRERILQAAASASTSCGLQITSIIRVTDPQSRRLLAHYAGDQQQVIDAPEFWVFCIDYDRNLQLLGDADYGWMEQFLVGCQDTGIMGQAAMTALESLGYGGCFIGGIRNHIEKVDELLELPANVVPLFGLAFGRPAQQNELKPRLPQSIQVMNERYRAADPSELTQYDEKMRRYYLSRSEHPKDVSWSQTLSPVLEKERRQFMLAYLQKKGFCLR